MISQFFSQNHGCFAPESHKEKTKKSQKAKQNISEKPDFANLASKEPNWQPGLYSDSGFIFSIKCLKCLLTLSNNGIMTLYLF